jgi:hypothetical protein
MAAEPTVLSALPHPVALDILALLPADLRARCACVCRGWRALIADPSLWTRLDLSEDSGVTVDVDPRVLRGAVGRARGALEALHVSRVGPHHPALLEMVTANAGTLRELRTGPIYGSTDELAALLRAAPALCELFASASCTPEQASALLRNEPPYEPLRMRSLLVMIEEDDDDASVLELAAALPAHASLRCLTHCRARLTSAVECDALVDAALAVQLQTLELRQCALAPASAPALARLLGGGTLTRLELSQRPGLLDEPASAAVLAAALRASTTLTSLTLSGMGLWRAHTPGAVLLGALVGHRSLKVLHLGYERIAGAEVAAAAGLALGALLAADAPALTELNVCDCNLGDAALGSLCDALPRNTHLRRLDIAGNDFSEAFAAGRLLPAVRANASLRKLWTTFNGVPASAVEAMRLVDERAADEEAAAGARTR